MKKVLIHSLVFSPDSVSTAYLYNDIALKFLERGYEVVVVTTTPHYNVLEEAIKKQPVIAKMGGLYYESSFNGIRVIHIPQKKFKNFGLRIAGFFYWHLLSIIHSLLLKNLSIILSPSPPLTIGLINIFIGKIKKAKVIYNVQEIYPDFLLNQGNIKFKPFIRILQAMERFVYNKSDAVTTIDPVFYQIIAPRFRNKEKLHIIPNFVDTALFKPGMKDESALNALYFPAKNDVLKVMYAGNIGLAQDWTSLIEIAKRLRDSNIEFWVVGEGVLKSNLETEIRQNNLENIHLVSYQSREKMPFLLSYADIHFIFMTPEMDTQGFPSKVYTIMSCAKPLLVISGANTPIYSFLKSAGCAYLIDSGVPEQKYELAINCLRKALYDREELNELGIRGYEFILGKYSKSVVTSLYVDLSDRLLTKP